MRNLSAAIFIALFAGCTGENPNCDNGDCTDVNPDCTDNCVDPVDEMGTLTVQVTADGASVDTSINEFDGGEHILLGMTGDVIDLEAGSYKICAGSTDQLTEDNLPVITHDGRMWTSSTIDVSIAADADEQESITLNQFVEGTWSCELDWGTGSLIETGPASVEYGSILTLDGISNALELDGSSFTVTENGTTVVGQFESANIASGSSSGDLSIDFYCWEGGPSDDPR